MDGPLLASEDAHGQWAGPLTRPEYTMEMTWDNLTKFFTWAAKQGSNAPLADTAGEAIVIDGAITKEDFERFWSLNPNLQRSDVEELRERAPIRRALRSILRSGLKAKGVTFEHHDLPGMTRDGDVHVGGALKLACFKDPDGNILNIASR